MMLKIIRKSFYIFLLIASGMLAVRYMFFDGDKFDAIIAILALIMTDLIEIQEKLDRKD